MILKKLLVFIVQPNCFYVDFVISINLGNEFVLMKEQFVLQRVCLIFPPYVGGKILHVCYCHEGDGG